MFRTSSTKLRLWEVKHEEISGKQTVKHVKNLCRIRERMMQPYSPRVRKEGITRNIILITKWAVLPAQGI